MEESFFYDTYNRLTEVGLNGVHSQVMTYDGYGRMTSKTAGGQAVFSGAVYDQTSKPHALDKAVTASGLFPSTPQTVSYTGFDKVSKVKMGNDSLVYTYGYGHQRIAMEEHVGNTVRTKRYVGACERVTETMGSLTIDRWLTYLSGPFGVFAVVERRQGVNTLHYILKDHLGSWTTVTDSDGTLEQRLSYDAWGNLRDPNTWSGSFTGTPMFDRGFTGHEHLYNFGLINMNGRMYDPMMSLFLSVDQYVQSPEELFLTIAHEYLHLQLFSLGYTLESQKDFHHASISRFEYDQAKLWKYRVDYYHSNLQSYAYYINRGQYIDYNVYFSVISSKPIIPK